MQGNIVGDAFQSHNQNQGYVFEDNENKATIVAQSKQRVNGKYIHLKSKNSLQSHKTVSSLQTMYTV